MAKIKLINIYGGFGNMSYVSKPKRQFPFQTKFKVPNSSLPPELQVPEKTSDSRLTVLSKPPKGYLHRRTQNLLRLSNKRALKNSNNKTIANLEFLYKKVFPYAKKALIVGAATSNLNGKLQESERKAQNYALQVSQLQEMLRRAKPQNPRNINAMYGASKKFTPVFRPPENIMYNASKKFTSLPQSSFYEDFTNRKNAKKLNPVTQPSFYEDFTNRKTTGIRRIQNNTINMPQITANNMPRMITKRASRYK